jgi:parallel beta-helix repeat protein
MKRLLNFLLFIGVTFFSSLAYSGTSYYVDGSARNDGNGSFLKPWNNIASVNDHKFDTGDDVYFKVGTACNPSSPLKIDWEGTPKDHTVIGAYYGNGQFGLGGNARPIIDGNNHAVPTFESWRGMVENKQGTNVGDYVDIQDLYIKNSGGNGICLSGVTNVSVTNCYIYRAKRGGILFSKIIDGVIDRNTVEESSYLCSPMAAIIVSGANVADATYDITISRNKVFHCYEGIGLYKMVRNCIVENNVLYDNRSYQIYTDAGKENVIRYNVIYGSSNWADWKSSRKEWASAAIVVDVEQERCNQKPGRYPYGDSNKIYGNKITNTKYGIALLSTCDGFVHTDNKIYKNIVVGCGWNFYFADDAGWSGNEVYNNVSWNLSDDGVRRSRHSNDYSPKGTTWSGNNFSDSVSGNAAINARIYIPELNKSSGWHSIEPGTADGTEWMEKGSEAKALNPPQSLLIIAPN